MTDSAAMAAGLRIGILGGSFNPAHQGHLDITDAARRALGLDRVWWLVSPQNPLKSDGDYWPFDQRMALARQVASGRPWLRVSDLEQHLPSNYTAETLSHIVSRYPHASFVWIMGADSLAGFHRWHHWRQIAQTVPVCVISRPGYTIPALTSRAARVLAPRRMPPRRAIGLVGAKCPAWTFLSKVHNPISASQIRQG